MSSEFANTNTGSDNQSSSHPVLSNPSKPLPDALLHRGHATTFMRLSAKPRSAVALEAVDRLSRQVIQLKGKQKHPSEQYVTAVAAAVADLLTAASHDPIRACWRPLKANSFTDGPVGYDPFIRALADLERNAFVKVDRGVSAWGDRKGFTTRVWITPKLTDHLASYGINPANRRSHFTYKKAAEDVAPIQLRARSIRNGGYINRGKLMKVDWTHPAVIAHSAPIRRLNAFLAGFEITGPSGAGLDDIALYRGFNDGDQADHNYRKGGRTYAAYQSLPRQERASIKINGESTMEVDISACFLTIAYYLLGWPCDPSGDLYTGTSLPRDIVKAWVNLTISNSGYPTRWPTKTAEKLKEKGFHHLSKDFPAKKIKDEICRALPIIPAWCDSEYGWADLHFVESQIMVEAMDRLSSENGIPSLPMHDALRVRRSDADVTASMIKDVFISYTGITPKVG